MIGEEQDKISHSCSGNVIMTDLNEKFVFMNNQGTFLSLRLYAFSQTYLVWHLLIFRYLWTIVLYVNSAITSAIYGVIIAFVVLLLSTRVFHCEFLLILSFLWSCLQYISYDSAPPTRLRIPLISGLLCEPHHHVCLNQCRWDNGDVGNLVVSSLPSLESLPDSLLTMSFTWHMPTRSHRGIHTLGSRKRLATWELASSTEWSRVW